MSQTNLFVPKNQKEETVDQIMNAEQTENLKEYNQVLMFASRNSIYVLQDFSKRPVKVAQREKEVLALGYNAGKLYDGGLDNQIFETLTNMPVAQRTDWVRTLCSYDGDLYDGGDYNKIYKTLDSEEVANREDSVFSLCSHNMGLFDTGHYKKVMNTKMDTMLFESYHGVECIYSHEDRLYFVEPCVIRKQDSEFSAHRKNSIRSLCSYKGQLYDTGFENKIFQTLSEDEEDWGAESEQVFEWNSYITSLITIPKNLVKQHLEY